MLPLLAALAAALAVFAAAFALVSRPGARRVQARVDRFVPRAEAAPLDNLAIPFRDRAILPALRALTRAGRKLFPASVGRSLERRLLLAGEPMSVHAFIVFQLIMVILGLAVVAYGLSRGAAGLGLLSVVILGAACLLTPRYWLRFKRSARQAAILKALPDAVNLIATTVEAGLGIDAALAEVGRETAGPLGEELRMAVRETALGRGRKAALLRVIERTQVPELRTFLQSIIQAEQTGIPVGQVLRTQAGQMRIRRRQSAEAQAQRAPVKMIVVLVLFVLPSMLLMIIGPAFLRMGERLG